MTDPIDALVADTSGVAAGLAAAEPTATALAQTADGHVLVVATRDSTIIHTWDLEKYLPEPQRPRGTVTALTAEGFIKTFDQRTTPDTPATVYADVDRTRLIAVLNDDELGAAGWRDHRITYQPQLTPEWRHWTSHTGLTDQATFAKALEDGETEIRDPSATVMLDLAQTFQASLGAKFRKAGRLKDGRTQLVYEEEIEATAGEGMAAIPDAFTIEVRPFYGADPVMVTCKLRYTLARGDLQIGYVIHRPEEIVRNAFEHDVVARVAAALEGFPVIFGVPADPTPAGR